MCTRNRDIRALMKARRNLDKMPLLADLLRSKLGGKYPEIEAELERIARETIRIANATECLLRSIERGVIQKEEGYDG